MTAGQPPMSDETFQAVMLERTGYMAADLTGMRADVADIKASYVPRKEWEQRNVQVDERFQNQGREIGELKRDQQARRTPWDRIVSIVLAAVALGLVIVFQYAQPGGV